MTRRAVWTRRHLLLFLLLGHELRISDAKVADDISHAVLEVTSRHGGSSMPKPFRRSPAHLGHARRGDAICPRQRVGRKRL